MFHYAVAFNTHSSTLGSAASLDKVRTMIDHDMGYYFDLYEDTHLAYLVETCDTCDHGKVLKCRAPRRHSNGYHGPACLHTCPDCHGAYETALTYEGIVHA